MGSLVYAQDGGGGAERSAPPGGDPGRRPEPSEARGAGAPEDQGARLRSAGAGLRCNTDVTARLENPRVSDLRLSHRNSRLRDASRKGSGGLDLDLDVDAGGEVESLERLDRLPGRLDDVEEALVDAHLEVLAGVLVDVR